MVTVTKKDLMNLGYGSSFATDIIREVKKGLISKGYSYYSSKKLDRVPKEAVEEFLGIKFEDDKKMFTCTSCTAKECN